jgi:para-nitrobenzyl esterase
MRQRAIYLFSVALAGASAFAQPAPTASVTGGQIRGRSLNGGAVFKGVPFAAPPEGQLRWKPPMPVKAWTGLRDAGEYAATCAQVDAGWNKTAAAAGKEDCLYLNVWTPEWPSRSNKPVMLWIHGGANMGGSALGSGGIEPPFDGESLSRHGVVVVTINYRLGLLGFLAHPELTAESPHHASGNYGLLDILAALQWVKQNIAVFGGDPAKVTVFGQSAGGSNTAMMLVSPLSKGLFARAIEESGTVIGGARLTPALAEAERRGLEFAAKMHAPSTGALAYMRSLPAAEVLEASPPYGLGGIGPVVDGYVITDVPGKSFAEGREHRLPLLIGNNARERPFDGGEDALRKAIEEFYKDLAPRASALYANAPAYAPYGDAGAQFLTDSFNRCPSVAIAGFHAGAGNPVWEYEFSHAFPGATNGAVHSGELRYVFGVFPPGTAAEPERKISDGMQTYWTNFARTGDPNGAGLPVWPRFDSKARGYLEFTDAGPVAKQNLRGAFCQLWSEFLKQKMETVKMETVQ